MNKIISIVLIVIFSLVFLILGVGIGFFYQGTLQTPLQTAQIEKTAALIKNLSSKTVLSTVVYGRVTAIEGKNITVSYSGDSIKISMGTNSVVNSFVIDSAGKPVQTKVDFSAIKVGDNVNIIIKFLPDGQIQGQSVLILLSNKTVSK